MEKYTNRPQSREIDCENPFASDYKVKFMCSYGGKIQSRPYDNQLAYIGGDTKILTVDRKIGFSDFMSKLSALCTGIEEVCFKYQLPGENLDATLISVTNEEDLENMMIEYDPLNSEISAKHKPPARLRLFLFPLKPPSSCGSNEKMAVAPVLMIFLIMVTVMLDCERVRRR